VVALKEAGILIAIDDVGAGRGTLDSVILFEPDYVKIDRGLVEGAATDPRRAQLLRRVVRLVESLESQIIAEGVESQDDLRFLRSLDVPYAQGFLWSKPIAPPVVAQA